MNVSLKSNPVAGCSNGLSMHPLPPSLVPDIEYMLKGAPKGSKGSLIHMQDFTHMVIVYLPT